MLASKEEVRLEVAKYIGKLKQTRSWRKFIRCYRMTWTEIQELPESERCYMSDVVKEYNNLFVDNHGDYCAIYSGAEKTALVFENSAWVIKFMNEKCDADNNNSCMVEAYNYAEAVRCGVSRFFAPTYFYRTVDGIAFYIQKKCYADDLLFEDKVYDFYHAGMTDKEIEEESEYCDCSYGDPETTGAWLENVFGYGEYEAFDRFCYDHDINDIHCANIAYDEDDNIVVIDFSGFHCDDWFGDWYEKSDKSVIFKI